MVWTPRKTVWTRQPQRIVRLNPDVVGSSYQGFVARPMRSGGQRQLTSDNTTEGLASASYFRVFSGLAGYMAAPAIAGTEPWSLLVYGIRRATGSSAIATLAEDPGSGTCDRSIGINATGKLQGYAYDGGPKTSLSAENVPIDTPFSGAVVCNGTTLISWLDGTPSTATAVSNAGFTGYSTPELVIGYGGGPLNFATCAFSGAYVLKIERAVPGATLRDLANNPWLVFDKPKRRIFKVGGGATIITLGQATETDTAQPFTAAHRAALGQPAETDTAQPVTARQALALGQPSETDTAQAITALQARALGQATETDLAQPITTGGVAAAVGQASETDTAQALTARQTRALGQATESDSAQPIAALQVRALGQAAETDLAQPMAGLQVRALGQASETETAQPITLYQPGAIGQASEADTAQALTARQARAMGQASEADTAQPIAARQLRALGQASETDSAQPVALFQPGAVGQAAEVDIAQPITGRQLRALGQATESDSAQPITVLRTLSVGLALEIDVAQPITARHRAALGQAIETDSALTITPTTPGSGTADPADVWNYVLSNGLTAEETAVQTHAMLTAMTALLAGCPTDLALVLKLLRNKQITNPTTGRMTVYDDDGSTVLLEGNLFEDAAGSTPYRGQGAERRERLA